MKFMVISDLHGYTVQYNQEYKDTTLIIAGDMHEVKRLNAYKVMIQHYCSLFERVILVPGNHEYWKTSIHGAHKRLLEIEDAIDNFIFLQNRSYITDGVMLCGATLWSDYDNNNPVTMFQATLGMNDYRFIRYGPVEEHWRRKFTPEAAFNLHLESRIFLKNCIDKAREMNDNLKVLVITHHAPSSQSVSPQFIGDHLNGCYVSNMDNFILDTQPDFWIHGHVHTSFDYNIDNTRVICNPRGYYSESAPELNENSSFNPTLTFEV